MADPTFPDILSPDYARVMDERRRAHEAPGGPVMALIDSPPAAPAEWQVASVTKNVQAARSAGLNLPPELVVEWRAGGEGTAEGATTHNYQTGESRIYLRVAARDLPKTTKHELAHCHMARSGAAERLSEEAEERLARDFADGLVDVLP